MSRSQIFPEAYICSSSVDRRIIRDCDIDLETKSVPLTSREKVVMLDVRLRFNIPSSCSKGDVGDF